MQVCLAGDEPDPHLVAAVGNRTCDEVLDNCYYCLDPDCELPPPDWCHAESWDRDTYDLDRIEAMLIMMQDMIDLAGHYQWITPEIWGEEDAW